MLLILLLLKMYGKDPVWLLLWRVVCMIMILNVQPVEDNIVANASNFFLLEICNFDTIMK